MSGRLSTRKTVLVTGGLGFIGSHFVEACLAAGHHVINYDKVTYAADLCFGEELLRRHSRRDYEFVRSDIAELASLPRCDIIVNFAAESHVDNSIEANDIFMKSNVLGVHRLLELIKNASLNNKLHGWNFKVPLFVQVSTDEVFGDTASGHFCERDVHTPSNPYSASKSCAEQLVVSWGRTYEIPYIITRTTNNYGQRQHVEKLIPNVITRLIRGDHVIVHGDGSYVRNWIHVLDNVSAIYRIIDIGNINRSYHISTPEELSVRSVVEMLCEMFFVRYDDVVDSSIDRNGGDLRYALDCSDTLALGWRPMHTLGTSLSSMIDFYRLRVEA
jgi:dTDP-glucose 4,6-dehydratase